MEIRRTREHNLGLLALLTVTIIWSTTFPVAKAAFDHLTPELLRKVAELVAGGVQVVGRPPERALGLEGFPQADAEVRARAAKLWQAKSVTLDKSDNATATNEIYPDYATAANLLARSGVTPDFEADADLRYIHRHGKEFELYFVGNRTDAAVAAHCTFRVAGLQPELWDAVTGAMRPLPEFREVAGRTIVPLQFAPAQSYFIVFRKTARAKGVNFPAAQLVSDMSSDWSVTFDPKWGGPETPVTFATLQDWTQRPEDGIRHYSGTAIYQKQFAGADKSRFSDL